MFGLIGFDDTTKVQRTRFPKHLCEQLLTSLEPTIIEGPNTFENNLKGIERSRWDIHRGREEDEAFIALRDHTITYIQATHASDKGCSFRYIWDDCWIMRGVSEKEGFVEPHSHSKHWGAVSFSLYLKLPNGPSELTFLSVNEKNDVFNRHIIVEEGDMIVFPGNALHYSKDITPGRTVLGGNAIVHYLPPEKDWTDDTNEGPHT